jgi:hypothetical protein
VAGRLVDVALDGAVAVFESDIGLLAPLVDFPPFLLASLSARYCLRLISKSLSWRYSSKEAARLVGACLIFGISSRVECSCIRAMLRYWTTASVCFTNVRYMFNARSASGFDNSK